MKAKIENGQIKKIELPKYYKHWAGNFDVQSDEIHKAEGFYDVITPEYDVSTQKLGSIFWDAENEIFTYPVDDIVFDLEEVRAERISQFEAVLDEFAVLISRCQLTYGTDNEGLNAVIAQTRQMQIQTMININAIDNVEAMRAFQIQESDVAYFKGLFQDYKM